MAYITVKVEGYCTVEVPDGDNESIMTAGNEKVQDEDFGALRNIEWRVSSIEHDDGGFEEFI